MKIKYIPETLVEVFEVLSNYIFIKEDPNSDAESFQGIINLCEEIINLCEEIIKDEK